jgi:hypothetical protein
MLKRKLAVTTYSKTVAIFTAKSQFNVVDSFYKQVPFETASSMFTLSVNKTVRVPNMTFESLLDTMLVQSSSYDMFLIVDHGLENSKKIVTQLSMPLTDKTMMKTRDDVCEKTMMKTRDDVCEKLLGFMNSNASDTDMTTFEKKHALKQNGAALPPLPAGCISRIVGKMKDLRKKKVRWVNIRACALGTNPTFMNTLGQCFSALFINAPDTHMFYSDPLRPNVKAKQPSYDQFAKTGGVRAFDDGAGQGLALQATGLGPLRHVNGKTTATELKWFMNKFFDPGNKYPPGNQYFSFQIEGMDVTGPGKFALPTEAEYAQHIVWSNPLPGNLI